MSEMQFLCDTTLNEKSRKTKMQIINKYVGILAENPDAKPTVKNILEVAGVTRSTFYSYFDNVEDLSQCIINEFVKYAEKYLLQTEEQDHLVEMLTNWFKFCKKNQWYYVTLTNARPRCFTNALIEVWKKHLNIMMDFDEMPQDMFRMMHLAYIPRANEGMTYSWLTDPEISHMPAKVLAQIVNNQRINYVAENSINRSKAKKAFLIKKSDMITSEVVSTRRMQELIKTGGSDFLHTVFTEEEILQAEKSTLSVYFYLQYYTAKRAVSKCVKGHVDESMFQEISIVLKDNQPLDMLEVLLKGNAASLAAENNLNHFWVSVSYEAEYATAFVIATI